MDPKFFTKMTRKAKLMMMMMMISKFNGTSTPEGSYGAKTVVNCPMSLNRVHYRKECYGQVSAKSKAKCQVTSLKKVQQ